MANTQPPPPRKGAYHKHIQVLHKDQHRSLQSKHGQEMLLLDSIKGFFKQRFALEKQHFEALSKICSSQYRAFECIKKLPTKDPESNEIQPYECNIFSIWIEMLQSIEEKASNYASSLQELEAEILKDVKKLKACKQKRMKKFFERVSYLHKEVETSVTELDRTKRIYFNEESEALETKEKAKDADDIARGKKKNVKSFFVSKSKLKQAAGNLSVKQEEVDIRSTGARNDYILSLATANAHQHRYYQNDFPEIIQLLEADIYDKVRNYYKKYIEVEMDRAKTGQELFENLNRNTLMTSRNTNFQLFGVAYPSLADCVTYTFENCPGDTIEQITTSEHDGGYSLNYEARQNASKLNQAVKTINAFEKRIEACQYHRSKGLTREPNDTGGPDLETKILELQVAISNAHTDKAKAEARLNKLRDGGVAVDEYIDAFVMERKRQQEAAERAREAAAAAAKAEANANDEENFDLREARADSFEDSNGQEQPPVASMASQPVADNWASWDDVPASPEKPAEDDWAAFDQQNVQAEVEPQHEAPAEAEPVNLEGLQQVNVLYNFDAQNSDELTITENEMVYLANEECDEEGWAVCINAHGQKGYVPLNYLEIEAEAQTEAAEQDQVPMETTTDDNFVNANASAPPVAPVQDDDNWGFAQFQAQPPPAQPQVPTQPPPWEMEDGDSSEDEESYSEATDTAGPPPSDLPPPIPDCPPPEFSASISVDNSLSTFGTDYCVGMYDYEATGSDEISFRAGDKIKILNRIPNGVDDGWWKGIVKNGEFAGSVGLFPSIICEGLSECDSDSDGKTEDSIESPLSSCAPPQMLPPPLAAPCLGPTAAPIVPTAAPSINTGNENKLATMEIVVTAPTPTVQSPVEAVQPPAQPPRPPPANVPKLEKQVAQDVPKVVIQETLEEVSSPESEIQPFEQPLEAKPVDIKIQEPLEAKVEIKIHEPPENEPKFEADFEANFEEPKIEEKPNSEEKTEPKFEADFEANFEKIEEKPTSFEEVKIEEKPKFEADFEANFDQPKIEDKPKFEADFEANFEQPQLQENPKFEANFEAHFEEPKIQERPKIESKPSQDSKKSEIDFDEAFADESEKSKSDSSGYSESENPKKASDSDSETESRPVQNPQRSLQRVDTENSSDSEGPKKSDSDSDSSDHVPPEDLHVKQLKKLDTLKESSA